MREIIHLETAVRETLVDITDQVRAVVGHSGISDGLYPCTPRARPQPS